jgi:RNA polymerase sigma factor (sigma-70 family)
MTPTSLGSPLSDQSDADLLAAFVTRGDDSAFAALMSRYAPLVFQTARRIVQTRQDAEDVSQATFLALAQKAPRLDTPEQLSGWLRGVATRISLRLRRTNARRATHERSVAALRNESPERKYTNSEVIALLEEVVAALAAALSDCDGEVQDLAIKTLGRIGPASAAASLLSFVLINCLIHVFAAVPSRLYCVFAVVQLLSWPLSSRRGAIQTKRSRIARSLSPRC